MTKITFIYHTGVRIEMDGMNILADPYSKTEYTLWNSTPDCIAESMILQPNANLTIFTHDHTDHFNLDFTLRILKQHPEMKIICGRDILNLLKNSSTASDDLDSRILSPGSEARETVIRQGSVTITMIPTIHDCESMYSTENYAVLIEGSRRILILGDTKPIAENFVFLRDFGSPNLLLAPFTYLTLRNGRKIVYDLIQPSKAAFLHFPVEMGDGILFRDAAVKSAERLRSEGRDVILLMESGYTFPI